MAEAKVKAVAIDMTRYINSEEIHEKCTGCDRVFDFTPVEGMITSRKCLAYVNPASKWPGKEKYAMMTATVRETGGKKGNTLVEKEIPILEKICPLASHVTLSDIVNTSSKTRAGQQKQK